MATIVVEFGMPAERVEFSGSSEADMRHAKMFWQSMQMNSPMESTLVSNDISQRLRVAAPGHQGSSQHTRIEEDSTKLKAFLARAHIGDEDELNQKKIRKNAFRQADIELLYKHRQLRIEKEMISAPHRMHGVRAPDPAPVTSQDPKNNESESADDVRKHIEEFEMSHATPTSHDNNSDK
ncbi:hypothetical protein CAPTEDRAFT_219454 [Capitella teleta]|uniref:Cilia- and flagella-associated protein HOATZ n=1 Tax=Capitella teleta TaxID=283909 RepID=R7V9I3_CAPTE|nr:hypothetical protein CAPTEDRAFT_219454 [Capitella teleta]|eukprot:ELU15214.1 hypothetical protein CAPTEDRAFT_219454 [Capitella teleta]